MNILALTYWSYNEPLIQAATLPHLETILRILPAGSNIFLLTLEKKHLAMDSFEKQAVEQYLKTKGITLIVQNYYPFGMRAAGAWTKNLWKLKRLCKKEKIDYLHAFGTPVGAATYALSKLSGLPFVVDSYEPHAEAMVENNTWKKNSIAFRMLFYLEKMQTKHAAAVLPASPLMNEYAFKKYGILPANSFPKPATVNTAIFKPAGLAELQLKQRIHTDKIVGIYAGKFGGIYLENEIFILIKAAQNVWQDKFEMVVLSDASEHYIRHKSKLFNIPDSVITLKNVKHSEVHRELQMADFAINPVKPVPSKRYCTSIKDGEYWATGLPVIIPSHISDDSHIIEENNAGVIWKDLSLEGATEAIQQMEKLLGENRESRTYRIRNIALNYRDSKTNAAIYEAIYGINGIVHLKIKRILVLIYNSFGDPLFQNLMFQYIKTQSQRHPNYRFDLLTFEQKEYALSKENLRNTKIMLTGHRIYWHPLQYHSGRFLLLKKFFDFLLAAKEVLLIRLKAWPEMIFSFANAAAAIGIVLAKLFRTKHMVYSYEPHSAFLVDFGVWKKDSLKYKIMSRLEHLAGMQSNVILTGTDAMKTDLELMGSKASIYRAPSAVNDNIFYFNTVKRNEIRNKLNVQNRKVIIYVGKFGGIYYEKEIAEFLYHLYQINNNYFFVVLSPNVKEEVQTLLENSGLKKADFHIDRAHSAAEVAAWNSAADAGLNAIPPLPNQKYRSPVKVAEYLLCGLPYIVCEGVSEDDVYALKYHVGAVVSELSADTAQKAHEQLVLLFNEDQDELRKRCRKVGLDYRSKSKIDDLLEKIIAEN